MIKLGEIQTLEVLRKTSIGVYLNSKERDSSQEDILLPNNQVSQEIVVGGEVEVFVYKDSEDRMIATKKTPLITIGGIALLRVAEITNIGTFLDWGLEKDLLLPFKEQTRELKKDDKCLVKLYVDRSNRLCATMFVCSALSKTTAYKENQKVQGVIYNINKDIGAFVAIDNKFDGVIPTNEFYGTFKCGDIVDARVKKIKLNGVIELSLREVKVKQMDIDSQIIMDKLESNGGKLALNDNTNPEKIKKELNMSKSSFKRAIGKLYKARTINITETGIEKVD